MDGQVEKYLVALSGVLDGDIPKAYVIYMQARAAYLKGDLQQANRLKNLNHVLHSSEVPYTAQIGKNTIFAYGGMGVIIHSAAVIGERCNIGSNVTIGGDRNGVPIIGDDVYLSSGSKIIGKVHIGHGAIVGANAVVKDDVKSFDIVAGIPARTIGSVTRENFNKYSGFYWCKMSKEGAERFADWYFPIS